MRSRFSTMHQILLLPSNDHAHLYFLTAESAAIATPNIGDLVQAPDDTAGMTGPCLRAIDETTSNSSPEHPPSPAPSKLSASVEGQRPRRYDSDVVKVPA